MTRKTDRERAMLSLALNLDALNLSPADVRLTAFEGRERAYWQELTAEHFRWKREAQHAEG